MKTQISRDAHEPDKRYSGVYHQQGRMLTDADWNALADIVKQRLDEALADVIGSGAPRERGFKVEADLRFDGRRLYADGVPAEVVPARVGAEETFNYGNQADFPNPPPLPVSVSPPQKRDGEPQVDKGEPRVQEDERRLGLGSGFTLYADLWERTVVSLEDTEPWAADHLRDPALHGADTTTRTQTMAQIKWCPALSSPEKPEANPRIGDSRLSVALRASQAGSDECDPCAKEVAIPQRVGNYLFRVEVHDVQRLPSAPTEVTLKWSSENGAEQHRIVVAPKVQEQAQGTKDDGVPADFKVGGFVYEFYNDTTEKHLGVHLVPDFNPVRGKLLEKYPERPPEGFDRVRRWDGYAVLLGLDGVWSLASKFQVPLLMHSRAERQLPRIPRGRDRDVPLRESVDGVNPGDLSLGEVPLVFHLRSLDVTLEPNSFVAGDYWLAPVRESIHRLADENARTVLSKAPPLGIVHHYLRLADVGADGTVQPIDTDRRQQLSFPPLTDLKARDVDYEPPCRERNQLFEAKDGIPVDTVEKALNRLCEIAAQHIGFSPPSKCTLFNDSKTVDQALNRLCTISAADVAYSGSCTELDRSINTVKAALDVICSRPSGRGCRVTIGPRELGGQFETLPAAVTNLNKREDICLCLLPGEHKLDENLTITMDGDQTLNFALCGCGRGSRLTIGKKGNLICEKVQSVRIENLLLQLDPPARLLVQGGLEVTLEKVVVIGSSTRPAGTPAPIVLHATTSVRVAASRLEFPNTLNDADLVVVEDLFKSLGQEKLRDLFSSQLDDEGFKAKRNSVAEKLVELPVLARKAVATGLQTAFRLGTVQLAAPLQAILEFFSEVIAGQAPELSAVSDSLAEIRRVAMRIVPSLALVLESAAGDATLVDNQILGVVSVYGPPKALPVDTIDRLRKLFNQPGTQLIAGAGRLSIARNEISRIIVGGHPLGQLHAVALKAAEVINGIYRIAFVAQNRFTAGGNWVLAREVHLTDNVFEPPNVFEPVDRDLGAVIAETAIYVGNSTEVEPGGDFFDLSHYHKPENPFDLNMMKIVSS